MNSVSVITVNESHKWLIDSGAAQHVCRRGMWFKELTHCAKMQVSLADGRNTEVCGTGKVYVKSLRCTLENVLFVPRISHSHNVISAPCVDLAGFTIKFSEGVSKIEKANKLVATGHLKENLYVLDKTEEGQSSANVLNENMPHHRCIRSLYRNLGHVSFEVLRKIQQCVGSFKQL